MNQSDTPFIDSILGVNELFYIKSTYDNVNKLTSITDIGNKSYSIPLYSYKNNNSLSLGYVITEDTVKYSNNPFENQNRLAKSISGLDLNIYEKVELKNKGNFEYEFSIDEEYFYFYNYFPVPINYEYYFSGLINDTQFGDQFGMTNSFNKGIILLKNPSNNKSTLKLKNISDLYKSYINPVIYTFNYDNYEKIIKQIQNKQMNIEYFEKNKIIGEINLDVSSQVMISVPYEKGWKIKVNEKQIDYNKAYDTFISLDLNKGYNRIEMVFIPPGLITGTIVSSSSIFLVIFINVKKRIMRRQKNSK
jgi:hypothetical protein